MILYNCPLEYDRLGLCSRNKFWLKSGQKKQQQKVNQFMGNNEQRITAYVYKI